MVRTDEKNVFSSVGVHNQELRHIANKRNQTNTVSTTRRMSTDEDDMVQDTSDSTDLLQELPRSTLIKFSYQGTANGCNAKRRTRLITMASGGQRLSAAAYLLSFIIFARIMG